MNAGPGPPIVRLCVRVAAPPAGTGASAIATSATAPRPNHAAIRRAWPVRRPASLDIDPSPVAPAPHGEEPGVHLASQVSPFRTREPWSYGARTTGPSRRDHRCGERGSRVCDYSGARRGRPNPGEELPKVHTNRIDRLPRATFAVAMLALTGVLFLVLLGAPAPALVPPRIRSAVTVTPEAREGGWSTASSRGGAELAFPPMPHWWPTRL